MRVLVTGAAGFVGRHVVSELALRDHDIVATDTELSNLHHIPATEHVAGDITDPLVRRHALRGCDAVIHLATVPGGAAESSPALARQINVDATMALTGEFARSCPGAPFIFASSIAVFGHPMPPVVDDETKPAPKMLYGAHKAMLENWLATLAARGDLSGLSLRLPGIVARPAGPSGMKSAFLSELFHSLAAERPISLPVSPEGTMWLMSVRQVATCLVHGLEVSMAELPASRAVTLPAVRTSIDDLVSEICRQSGVSPDLVEYQPDDAIEAGFGRQPPLRTPLAEGLGFTDDGGLDRLVRSALATLSSRKEL